MEKIVKSLLISVTAIVITIVVGVVLIMLFAPDKDPGVLVGLVAPTIASLAGLAGIAMVKQDTNKMLNGVMDEKIQTGVRTVLHEENGPIDTDNY